MENRLEKWEKYRTKIGSAPDWSFRLRKSLPSKHSMDADVMRGKAIGSKAISFGSERKPSRPLAYETYRQSKQTLAILKYTLFVVSIVLLIVVYVLWVR